jgi:hypothetical protein
MSALGQILQHCFTVSFEEIEKSAAQRVPIATLKSCLYDLPLFSYFSSDNAIAWRDHNITLAVYYASKRAVAMVLDYEIRVAEYFNVPLHKATMS